MGTYTIVLFIIHHRGLMSRPYYPQPPSPPFEYFLVVAGKQDLWNSPHNPFVFGIREKCFRASVMWIFALNQIAPSRGRSKATPNRTTRTRLWLGAPAERKRHLPSRF